MGRKKRILIDIFLSVIGFIWVFPVLFVVFNIFKTKQEYNLGFFWELPKQNYLGENLKYLLESTPLLKGMLGSLLYAGLGALFAVAIATLAAYGLTNLKIRHKMFWFLFIYSGTVFPFQIYLIPVYKAYSKVGLYNTRLGMVIFYTAICIPFAMFVMRNFFLGISKEICESAKVDGATDFGILCRLFIPMSRAPLAICFLAQFTWSWNELMFGLTFTKSSEIRPVMSVLSIMDKNYGPAILLACIIVSVPTLVLYFILQKDFEKGFVYTSK